MRVRSLPSAQLSSRGTPFLRCFRDPFLARHPGLAASTSLPTRKPPGRRFSVLQGVEPFAPTGLFPSSVSSVPKFRDYLPQPRLRVHAGRTARLLAVRLLRHGSRRDTGKIPAKSKWAGKGERLHADMADSRQTRVLRDTTPKLFQGCSHSTESGGGPQAQVDTPSRYPCA